MGSGGFSGGSSSRGGRGGRGGASKFGGSRDYRREGGQDNFGPARGAGMFWKRQACLYCLVGLGGSVIALWLSTLRLVC